MADSSFFALSALLNAFALAAFIGLDWPFSEGWAAGSMVLLACLSWDTRRR